MNEYPEITAIQPHEPGETPEGYVKMPIPFVGIYQSLLGADIDHCIDQQIEWAGDAHIEIKIHYDEIYSSIAEYTAILLGIKGAIYAGTVCPKYYNYVDDQPYLFVPEEWYRGIFEDTEPFYPCDQRMEVLRIMLREAVDDYYQREYDPLGDYIEQAVYAEWANGLYNGIQVLNGALEVEHIEYLE